MANWIRVASNGKIQFFYDDKATRMSVVSSMIKKIFLRQLVAIDNL